MNAVIYPNGHILPSRHKQGTDIMRFCFVGGVTDCNGNFVESSLLHEYPCDAGGAYETDCKVSNLKVIFVGYLLNVWGHTLTDGIKKHWYLLSEEGKKKLSEGYMIAFITLHNKPLPDFYKKIWSLTGINNIEDYLLQVIEPTKFAEVIVPDNSMVTYPDERREYLPEFISIIDNIKHNALKTTDRDKYKNRKVYLTRTKLKSEKDFGEKNIERFFKKLGYEIISPEKLSIEEQIALWNACDTVATTEGSIAHTSIMMEPGSNLIILRKANYLNGYQMSINKLRSINATYIDAHHSTKTNKEAPWGGPFFLYVSPQLQEWAGMPVVQKPFCMMLSYWMYILRLKLRYKHIKDIIYILAIKLRLIKRQI